VFAADVSDDLGFHFDGVGVGGFPETAFFGRGGGNAIGAVKTGGSCAGGDEPGLEVRGVVAVEQDGAEGEVGIESACEAAGQCYPHGAIYRSCTESRADGVLGVALAHAGEEDLDVGAGGDGGFEGRGFFFDGETNECER